ncbi:MAG: RluA family pseudouridine synthase, partial [Candidatus Rokuibacteriota bacterium]
DKPKDLVVHPAAGHASGTLVNALIAHCGDSLSGIGGVKRPGIVHRLDKDTTGLMVVAKTDKAHRALAKQFAEKGQGPLRRGYLAFVWGAPGKPKGTIDAPLGRHPQARDKQAVRGNGRAAVTHWQVLEGFTPQGAKTPAASLLACTLETGRTHQIRVHLAFLGHPVVGDDVYGRPRSRAPMALDGYALHAIALAFVHPVFRKVIECAAPIPHRIARLLLQLRDGV